MPASEPTFWEYVKAAFYARKRVPGLGGLPFNVLGVLGFGVLGLANPGFWLLGAGIEMGYLSWLSQNQRFRNLVRGERLRSSVLDFRGRLEALVARLPPASRERWRELESKCGHIRQATSFAPPASLANIDEMQESGLNSLLMIHARLLLSRETLLGYMKEASGRELKAKLADAESRLAATTSAAMKRSLEANVEILKKRLEHHAGANENLQVIEAELDRIENQVELIRAEAAVSRDPEVLSARIDSVAKTIGDANQFLKVNETLLGDIGGESDVASPLTPSERSGVAGS